MKDISIIYEDEYVVVVNKPAGLIVHSDGRTEEPTLVEWILEHYPNTRDVGEPWESPQGEIIPRPGIVHRLDRDTSGVIIIAKTSEAHQLLKGQFHERKVEKTYRAFVYGHMKENDGVVEAEIGRTRTTPPRWSAQFGARGSKRNAITFWKCLARGYASVDKTPSSPRERVSLIEAYPKTGRTHQIRVHMKALNHSVVCDSLYAPNQPHLLGFERLALHAFRLSVTLPNGEKKTFEAPEPEDFKHARQGWSDEA